MVFNLNQNPVVQTDFKCATVTVSHNTQTNNYGYDDYKLDYKMKILDSKGFTMIEIVVVIFITGVIGS